ncbi:MAG TPA: aldo/keto reductase, partial [Polyangiales bacterium]|nr:aldo/keto reductase [Polyangiales bacterium]
MGKRSNDSRDPEDEQRRQIVRGGLLAAAAALGFLPGCSDSAEAASGDGSPDAGGASPGAAGAGPRAGAPAADGGQAPARRSEVGGAARAEAGSSSRAGAGGNAQVAADAGVASGGRPADPMSAGAASPAAGSGGAMQPMAAGGLPRAMLGNTGVSVPIVGLGTSRLGQRGGTPNQADFDNMVQVFTKALDLGVEYVDTGAAYGRAEEALGKVLAGRRDKVFLATKLFTNTYSQAQMLFERSLERLGTDHVNLLHLHSVGQRDIDTVLSLEGAWRYILEQKAMGRARFVGITGHNNPPNFMRMLATDEVDVMMTIMNFVDHSTYGFSKTVREEALARGVGVMAMKVFGGTESVLRPGGGLANANSPVPLPSNM